MHDDRNDRAIIAAPFGGALYIAADARGVYESRWLQRAPAAISVARCNRTLRDAVRQTRAYFAHRLRRFELPLHMSGTDFQLAAWQAVARLEVGQLVSYSDIARAIGRPAAPRGVARALAATPLALFVPAHRVVGADGRPKGAPAGSPRHRLLRFEGALGVTSS